MLKILWKREEIAPEEQFLLLSTIFSYLMLALDVKTRIRFSLRDKWLFEITEVEITRVDCILDMLCSYCGTMEFSSTGGRSHFVATSPEIHIFIWDSPNTTHCKMVPF